MAQKVSTLLLCDLHDEQDVEAVGTTLFGIDGANYEIELCEDHGRQMRDVVGPFMSAGRRAGASPRPARSAAQPRRNNTSSPVGGGQAAVRQWARAHGYTVSDRGRLSSEVTAAYEAAQ